MKELIDIYVEGHGEVKLFSTLLENYFGITLVKDKGKLNMKYDSKDYLIKIIAFGKANDLEKEGVDNVKIRETVKFISQYPKELNRKNLLILDADTVNHTKPPGGFKKRREYIENLKKEFTAKFEYFLIPNHLNEGNLESLLSELIGEIGRPFYNCLENYTNCLSKLEGEFIPVEIRGKDLMKKRMEWYIYMMLGSTHGKKTSQRTRDYSNSIWDLDSEKLTPLVNFFNSYLPKIGNVD